MRTAERTVIMVVAAIGLVGCGGSRDSAPALQVPEGAASPEQAVETFLSGAQDARRHRAAGAFTEADRDYDRMAAVFGTEDGSVHRTMSAEEVRNRMIVLSACFRPTNFRIIAESDALARSSGRATVTVDVDRGDDSLSLPFSLVLGRGDRWFIDRIDMSNVSC